MVIKKRPIRKQRIQTPLSDSIPSEALESPQGTGQTGEDQDGDRRPDTFPIVGIGASAGGLAAFEAFFSGMPVDADPDMAFVLVQHLAPDHKSILADLIQRYTRLQVFEVEDGMVVRPNCAYIIPPNRDMAFLNGTLQLLAPSTPRGQRLPIDFFFRSLAHDQHNRAICIVLSGTGSDGTLGVRAIKGEGGMVMAQNPESTEYDGMPRSAIATGMVDYELPPAEMPAQLISYVAQAFGKLPRLTSVSLPENENALKKIFVLLRAHTGHDFSGYKPSTINRRIDRRMAVQQITTMDRYIKYLQQAPGEVEALFRDLLIGVTSFFRDPEAFKALEEQIIPRLFADKPAGSVIRAWIPGCSTGEEAYSLAILLQEHMEAIQQSHTAQIFATDIDSRAIATARAGLYPASIATDISHERLARFFSPAADGSIYHINKGVRDMIVFSEQDIINDPPFSRLDLISCRNLLIYMDGALQKKLISLFHYVLNPGGLLFLGTSETVGDLIDLFATLDRKLKIYQRKDVVHSVQYSIHNRCLPAKMMLESAPSQAQDKKTVTAGQLSLRELTELTLLEQIAPTAILINKRGDILYLHGRSGMYLELDPGETGINNILKMAREGLRHVLTTALGKVVRIKETIRYPGLRVKTNGDYTQVDMTIRPAAISPGARPEIALYLVILEEVPVLDRGKEVTALDPSDGRGDGGPAADIDADRYIATLKQDLQAKEEYLQTTTEELETSNEELKSSNEEMQSVNEELQSTNEELETSKEELQSLNEELATVNAELRTKVADLSRANNDMNNLLAGTGIATVFVDHLLHILRFTPSATGIINLIQSDIGRPVGHLVSNLVGYDNLVADTRAVLNSLIPQEVEVQTRSGPWYTMRIQPYRTLDNVIEGAVITFVDITERVQAQEALRRADLHGHPDMLIRDSQDAIVIIEPEGRILAWNPAAARIYGWTAAEALAMSFQDLLPEEGREGRMTGMLGKGQAGNLEPQPAQRICRDGRILDVVAITTALRNIDGKIYALASMERIQERRLTE